MSVVGGTSRQEICTFKILKVIKIQGRYTEEANGRRSTGRKEDVTQNCNHKSDSFYIKNRT